MKQKDPLESYRKKRHFDRTAEPPGKGILRRSKQPIFVVQKHDATRLHYDFRLEVGGVLKSWAIPKGPSTNPRDKRLAIPTEDHPIEYARFEGVIPEGEYGAGVVIVWDIGVYRNLTERSGHEVPMETALRHGRIKIWLDGNKVMGCYALTRISTKPPRWLFVKVKDNYADDTRDITKDEPRSALSGKTLEELRRHIA